MIEEKYQYFAFISYKREDEAWAKWLQHKQEHFKLPSNLNGRTDLPKEIRPVFKDTSELTPGNLPQHMKSVGDDIKEDFEEFLPLEDLIKACKRVTSGMKFSEEARRKFFTN